MSFFQELKKLKKLSLATLAKKLKPLPLLLVLICIPSLGRVREGPNPHHYPTNHMVLRH